MKPSVFLSTLFAGSLLCGRGVASDWTLVPSPNLGSQSVLFGVAGSPQTGTDVWAVGVGHNSRSVPITLVEHWDGTAWTITPSQNPSRKYNTLYDVAVGSTRDAWAVGAYTPVQDQETLIEHWNGHKWIVVPSPNVTIEGERVANILRGILYLTSRDIWAVGEWVEHFGGKTHTLAEHWDGRTWTIVPTPSGDYDSLSAINGFSNQFGPDIWAVGGSSTTLGGPVSNLTMHWDGTAWTVFPCPNSGTNGNGLNSVALTGSADFWACGSSGTGGVNAQTVVVHWNGLSWSIVPTPAGSDRILSGIVDVAFIVTTVGIDYNTRQPLSETWNGSSWAEVPVPPAIAQAQLTDVRTAADLTLWAVGGQADLTQTLIYKKEN